MSVCKDARWLASALVAGAAWFGAISTADAIPVFARQTGHNCQACHISYPELTAYGREFKLNGYTFGVAQPVPFAIATMQGITSVSNNNLNLPTAGTTPINDPNSKFEIMQSSIFSGGRATDNLGAFIQWTWSGLGSSTHSGIDNTEVRLVGRYTPEGALAPELVYGLDINNNMTMQDVWMGVPAWRFPWWGVGVPPSGRIGPPGPLASAVMEGLGQRAVGIEAYGWWRKTIYAEFGMYRKADGTLSFLRAGDSPTAVGDALDGYNPYVRVAYSRDWGYNSVEVGALYTHIRQHWDPTISASNTFNDFMIDSQYQYNKGEPWVFAANASYIHESASYDPLFVSGGGASNSGNTLREFFLRGTTYYDRKYGLSIGYTNITGSSDATLYGFSDGSTVVSSLDGNPASSYFVFEANYLPLQNLRITLQYWMYSKLNGVSGTDTFGNKVGDNDTLFAGIWWAF
jgi:hypothetical protein